MNIIKDASSGSLESSDVFVRVSKSPDNKVELAIDSIVAKQFGNRIRGIAQETLRKKGVSAAVVKIIDRGALEYTLRARLETALDRAAEL